MKEHTHEKRNPEDGWKDAEKLLDNHFRTKRNRRFIIVMLLLFLTSTGIYSLIKINNAEQIATSTAEVKKSNDYNVDGNKINAEKINANQVEQPQAATEKPSLSENKIVNSTRQNKTTIKKYKNNSPAIFTHSNATPANQNTASELNKEDNLQPTNNSIPASNPSSEENNSELVNNISAMSMRDISLQVNDSARLIGQVDKINTLKKKPNLDILVYGGASFMDKNIKGSSNSGYLQRRNDEEYATILPVAGLQLSKSKNKFDLRAGLELSVLGEKVNYSPYSNGEYYNNYSEWQTFQTTRLDTDSIYIFGILFPRTTVVTINDSLQVNTTDTLNGSHYDAAVQSANGKNFRYMLEIPVDVIWHINRNRFGVAIAAGIAPGILFKSKGNYLRDDESGTQTLSNENKMQFALNIRAGLEFSYSLNEQICLLFKPTSKFYLTGIKEKSQVDNRYRNIGLNVGVKYAIR